MQKSWDLWIFINEHTEMRKQNISSPPELLETTLQGVFVLSDSHMWLIQPDLPACLPAWEDDKSVWEPLYNAKTMIKAWEESTCNCGCDLRP